MIWNYRIIKDKDSYFLSEVYYVEKQNPDLRFRNNNITMIEYPLLYWDIYEIETTVTPIQGVMLRGRIRKFYLEKMCNILLENDETEPIVRFAVIHGQKVEDVMDYVHSIASDSTVTLVLEKIANRTLAQFSS